MTKRIISFVLVFVMLLGICVSAASCAQLEEYVGLENMGQDYIDKYHPDLGQAGGEGNDTPTPGKPGGEIVDNSNNHHDPDVPREEGCNLITFFWNNPLWVKDPAKLAQCDIWCWWDGGEGGGRMMKQCEYGAMLTLNIPKGVTEVGFIVRTGCSDPGGTSWGNASKDCGPDDLFATIEGDDTFIYLRGGKSDANQYHSNDGGKTLTVIKKFNLAGIVNENTIEFIVTPATKITSLNYVKVYDGDKEIPVTGISCLNKSTTNGKITVDAKLDITKTYTVAIKDFGEMNVVPTDVFDTDWFAENYHYDGDDLGATINDNGTTTFKVWAPTASKVLLNLFTSGHEG